MSSERFTRQEVRPRRWEISREIREELERLRRAEAKVAESLGAMRAARTRVEELARMLTAEERRVRELVREELESRAEPAAPSGGGPPADDVAGVTTLFEGARPASGAAPPPAAVSPPATAVAPEDRRSFLLVGVAAASVLTVAAVAWLAFRAFQGPSRHEPLTLASDGPVEEEVLPGMPPEPSPAAVDTVEEAKRRTERFFVTLPDDARQRAAVYDSLWSARSPLFVPLVEGASEVTEERRLRRSAEAWVSGQALPALEEDLLRSALVQYVLREEAGGDLAVDGQLLRNPCRGRSCSALLNLWESRGQEYGLPPVPDDAPRNPQALRMVENVVVLGWLRRRHGVGHEEAGAGSP